MHCAHCPTLFQRIHCGMYHFNAKTSLTFHFQVFLPSLGSFPKCALASGPDAPWINPDFDGCLRGREGCLRGREGCWGTQVEARNMRVCRLMPARGASWQMTIQPRCRKHKKGHDLAEACSAPFSSTRVECSGMFWHVLACSGMFVVTTMQRYFSTSGL